MIGKSGKAFGQHALLDGGSGLQFKCHAFLRGDDFFDLRRVGVHFMGETDEVIRQLSDFVVPDSDAGFARQQSVDDLFGFFAVFG